MATREATSPAIRSRGTVELGQDQPVRPLPVRRALGQEAVERGLPVDLVQDEVEAPLRQHRLDTGDDLPEVPAVEERDGHADGVRTSRGQSGGVGIGLVVEAGRGLGHPGPGVRGDVGEAPQGPAHGRDGDAGDGRHVADGRAVGLRSALSHVASLPSSSAGVTSALVVPPGIMQAFTSVLVKRGSVAGQNDVPPWGAVSWG